MDTAHLTLATLAVLEREREPFEEKTYQTNEKRKKKQTN